MVLQLWSSQLPQALEGKQAEFVPIDFFKDVPVKDCDYYYIRYILYVSSYSFRRLSYTDEISRHDWPSTECVKILSNVRAAMKPSSRVLIRVYLLF